MSNEKKIVSVIIPTYNEEDNVYSIYERIKSLFVTKLNNYDYEIIFIDNYSIDDTRKKIVELNKKDSNVKGIFNSKNFGFNKSCFYGLLQGSGDCTVLVFADMQDPPEVIEQFVEGWEKGYKIVVGVKNKSKENPFIYFLRSIYYKLVKIVSESDHIEHFTGFGLYDKSIINIMKNLEDANPYLRGIITELGFERMKVYYKQDVRKKGKTKFNFFRMYDTAMLGITSYSNFIMRLSTIIGFFMSLITFIIGMITLILKLLFWSEFQVGLAGVSVGIFFIGSVIIFFIGFIGEYVMQINTRVIKRPLVIEEKRIGFE